MEKVDALKSKTKGKMAKSMALNQAAGLGGMLKDGHKTFEGVRGAVIGPNGMNKLVVNHLEKIIVTSDCATVTRGGAPLRIRRR